MILSVLMVTSMLKPCSHWTFFLGGKLTETMGNIRNQKKSSANSRGKFPYQVNLPEPRGQFNRPTSAQEDWPGQFHQARKSSADATSRLNLPSSGPMTTGHDLSSA